MSGEGLCACDKPGEWVADPFIFEIYGETAMGFWCDDCLWERAMDV